MTADFCGGVFSKLKSFVDKIFCTFRSEYSSSIGVHTPRATYLYIINYKIRFSFFNGILRLGHFSGVNNNSFGGRKRDNHRLWTTHPNPHLSPRAHTHINA